MYTYIVPIFIAASMITGTTYSMENPSTAENPYRIPKEIECSLEQQETRRTACAQHYLSPYITEEEIALIQRELHDTDYFNTIQQKNNVWASGINNKIQRFLAHLYNAWYRKVKNSSPNKRRDDIYAYHRIMIIAILRAYIERENVLSTDDEAQLISIVAHQLTKIDRASQSYAPALVKYCTCVKNNRP